jgi:hypothetical protein
MDLKSVALTLQNPCPKVNPSVSKISLPLQNWRENSENEEKKGYRMDIRNTGIDNDCYIQFRTYDTVLYFILKTRKRNEHDFYRTF